MLSNETLAGTETLTAMQRRTTTSSTSAGVNGDFFTFSSGLPSGVLMREGQMASPPSDERSSAGVLTDGTLDVRRVSFVGTWQGAGSRRTLTKFNRPFPGTGIALYTDSWGPTTPEVAGATAAVLFPFPAAIPNTDLAAPVVELRIGGGAVPIPPGGAVLLAKGAAASALGAEAPVTQLVTLRLLFKPDWPNVVAAIGGGPQIVRDGAAVFKAGELFSTSQLGPRVPRSAIGQLADGRIVLVAVDGGQPGYSVGMTNFELAQALVRLGAVTGMAFDSGGSTTMAFDGSLLNKPSGPERAISTALEFQYAGVYVQPAVAVVSPDGDGVGDKQTLRYKLVRPSTVTVRLTSPDGKIAYEATATKQPGSYGVAFPPVASPPVTAAAGDPAADDPASDDPAADHPGASDAAAFADLEPDDRRQGDSGPHAGQVEAHRLGHRRRRAAVGDVADVPRQLDGRVPRDGSEEALPAPVRPRPPHPVEADEGRLRRRHRRDARGRGRPDARQAAVRARFAGRHMERPRPHEEGGQGRLVRRARGREKPARNGRSQPSRARATDRRLHTLTTVRRCSSPRLRAR